MTALEKKKTQEDISRLHAKYYAKKTRKDRRGEKIQEVLRARKGLRSKKQAREALSDKTDNQVGIDTPPVLGNTGEKAGTIADLRAQAQTQGIKYFGILNKKELEEVLYNQGKNLPNEELIAKAKARWKAGFGKKKGAQPCPTPGT